MQKRPVGGPYISLTEVYPRVWPERYSIHIQRKQSGAGESSGVSRHIRETTKNTAGVRSLDSGKSFASRSGTEQSCALHPEAADDCNLLKLQLMPNCGSGCICAGQPAFCPALARNSPSFVMLTDEPAFASLDHSYPGLLKRQVTMCGTKADSFILRALRSGASSS